jgi:hypothetical protein
MDEATRHFMLGAMEFAKVIEAWRPVVEAAQRWREAHDRVITDLSPEGEEEHLAAIDALRAALDALDIGDVMGGEADG